MSRVAKRSFKITSYLEKLVNIKKVSRFEDVINIVSTSKTRLLNHSSWLSKKKKKKKRRK